jgi:hypothetical protein
LNSENNPRASQSRQICQCDENDLELKWYVYGSDPAFFLLLRQIHKF